MCREFAVVEETTSVIPRHTKYAANAPPSTRRTTVSLRSTLKRLLGGAPLDAEAEPAPRHERREAGRDRHHETGEPAWEESDRLDEPPGAGKRDPDAAPEVLGGN